MKRLKILCDVDGTVLDLMPAWLNLLDTRLSPSDVTTYDMAGNPSIAAYGDKVWQALVDVDYDFVESMPGVDEHLPQLHAQHYIDFVTFIPDCYDTLSGYYGSAMACKEAKHAILSDIVDAAVSLQRMDSYSRARLPDYDVLIDDRQDTIETWAKLNPLGLAIMIAQPYNVESKLVNVARVEHWSQVARLIEVRASEAPVEAKFMRGLRVLIDTGSDGSKCHGMEGHIVDVRNGAVVVRTLSNGSYVVQEHEVVVLEEKQAASAPAPAARTLGMLPDSHPDRKSMQVFSGFVGNFPDAMVEVARVSAIAGAKYNNGKIAWHRDKGGDRYEALFRHVLDIAEMRGCNPSDNWELADDGDVLVHAQLAWNAMAVLQLLIDKKKLPK